MTVSADRLRSRTRKVHPKSTVSENTSQRPSQSPSRSASCALQLIESSVPHALRELDADAGERTLFLAS